MSLIPNEPFRQLQNMRQEWDRFFTKNFPSGIFSDGLPQIDVHETENKIVATCDIPGIEKKEDININVENEVLTISGNVNRMNEIKEDQMHRKERFSGRFQRTVTLPAPVSSEGIKASYKNGVLEVHMPKIQPDPKPRINVEFN